MIKKHQQTLNVLFGVCDCICIMVSMALAYFIRFHLLSWYNIKGTYLPFTSYIPLILFLVATNIFFYYNSKLYKAKRTKIFWREFSGLLRSNLLSSLVLIGFLYLINSPDFSRLVLFFDCILTVVLTSVFRYVLRLTLRNIRRKGYNTKHLLLIGTGDTARSFVKKIDENPQFGYKFHGCLSDFITKNKTFCSMKVLGTTDDLEVSLITRLVDEVVVAVELSEYHKLEYFIAACEKQGVKINIVPAYYSYMPTKPELDSLGGIPILTLRALPLSNLLCAFSKRLMDIVGAIICLTVASPVMIVTAIVLKFSTNESVIFKQPRVGYNYKLFNMYKFRSMKTVGQCDNWTAENDPRRTKFGSFIRRFSIDELPQFFNVLVGDMSIVGPRPELKKFVDEFTETIPRYMVKHQVKPGITGLAQIMGLRGDTSIEKRINADIEYIENWSLLLDVKIVFKTIFGAFYNKHE